MQKRPVPWNGPPAAGVLAVLAAVGLLAALAACEKPAIDHSRATAVLEVVIDQGRPVIRETDDHYAPEVQTGQRVRWDCPRCPEGVRFRVTDIHPACDSDFVPDDLRHYHEGQKELLLQSLEGDTPADDPTEGSEAGETEEEIRSRLRQLIEELPATDLPVAPDNPFEGDWQPPTEFARTVVSAPVKSDIRGCHFYKFTWEVEGAARVWDPHIYVHGGGGRR